MAGRFQGRYSQHAPVSGPSPVSSTLAHLTSQAHGAKIATGIPATVGPQNSGLATAYSKGASVGNSLIANRAHGGSGFNGTLPNHTLVVKNHNPGA